jgi:hypothetical protein
MRSTKMLLMVGVVVSAVAAACGGNTSNTSGNENDSGTGGSSGSSSGAGSSSGTGSSSGSSSGAGSSSGTGGSSGSSSGGQTGDSGLTCTATSCGSGSLCCVGFGGGMVTSMCVTGTMCPTGDRQVCDPNNPMCPPGDVCRVRMGGTYGTCRPAMDGGMGGDGSTIGDAGGGG